MRLYDWQTESLSGDVEKLAQRHHELQTELVALTYALHAAELQEMLDKRNTYRNPQKTKEGSR